MTASGSKKPEQIDTLFVQSASAFSAREGEITLHGLADATIYFAERPRREAGHMASERFIELWDGDTASFATEPPHAVLSFLAEPASALADVALVLREPHLSGHQLTYKVEVLNGTLPLTGGACSLFIDAFGRSLAPVSVRGIRRPRRPAASRTS
jgi:hypothetical protein